MMHTHNHFRHSMFREARLLSASLVPGSSFNQHSQKHEYKPEDRTKVEEVKGKPVKSAKELFDEFVNSKEGEGAREVFDAFGETDKITSQDIIAYILDKEASGAALTPYEMSLKAHVDTLTVDPATKKTEEVMGSEREIDKLVSYINSRNAVIKQQKAELKNLKIDTDETPTVTKSVLDKAKSVIGVSVERFGRADLTEKALLVGGVVSAFLLLRFAYMSIPGKGVIKKTLGVLLGAALTYSAYETIMGAGKKALQNKDEWDAEKHAKEIEQMRESLKKQDISEAFIKDIGDNEKKVVAPIANISTMDVPEFQALYENARSTKSIEEGDALYPMRPVRKDGLLPSERYAIVEDIAMTVGIADAQTGDLNELPPELEGKSMMYMMLRWNAPKKEEKKEEPAK